MSEEEEVPRLPIKPEASPMPNDWRQGLTYLLYAVTEGVHRLNTLIDIEIQQTQK